MTFCDGRGVVEEDCALGDCYLMINKLKRYSLIEIHYREWMNHWIRYENAWENMKGMRGESGMPVAVHDNGYLVGKPSSRRDHWPIFKAFRLNFIDNSPLKITPPHIVGENWVNFEHLVLDGGWWCEGTALFMIIPDLRIDAGIYRYQSLSDPGGVTGTEVKGGLGGESQVEGSSPRSKLLCCWWLTYHSTQNSMES